MNNIIIENSAMAIMSKDYLALQLGMRVETAMERVRNGALDDNAPDTIFIVDKNNKLLGTLGLRKLILSSDDELVDNIMDLAFVYANEQEDRESIAEKVSKYDLMSIPVLDDSMHLVGVVKVDAVVDIIDEKNTEDFTRMAAILPTQDVYIDASVVKLAWNRLPWSLVLMVSAAVTGLIISHFEGLLSSAAGVGVALTACIPMLMDTGGNCGAQTSTLIIRGLALNELDFRDMWKVLWKEMRIALTLGIILAVINFLRCIVIDKTDVRVALVVSLAIFATVLLAKLLGAALPLVAKKIHLDPALMAGPLIATMVDACSLIILFGIASKLI